ncbi:MAG: hypothetical protein FWE63_02390 [Bacteroidales bacterium]|nr:hypothetical protein [Bacteroidales bacterium]
MSIKKQDFAGKLVSAKSTITINIPVYKFKEDGLCFVYTPALEIVSYDKTERKSETSFHTMLEEFFNYTTNKKTLHKALEDLGWSVHPRSKTKRAVAPDILTMAENNPDFKDILNTKEYQKIDCPIPIPA